MNKFLVYIFCFVISSVTVQAQSKYKINVESGYLYSDTDLRNKSNEFLSRIDVKYSYHIEGLTGKIKLQPGFLGSKFKPKSLKFKSEVNYISNNKPINYGVNLSYQLNNYFEDDTHKLALINITGFSSIILKDYLDLTLRVSYNRQKTQFFDTQNIDRINFSLSSNYFINRYSHFNLGIFGEEFFIKSESNLTNGFRNENDGYRIGPVFSFNYTKGFIIRANYRYLYQKAEIFDQSSSEHNFRLVAGKFLNRFWSVFILIDYTQPVYDFELEKYNDKNLLYISSNYENNYFLKLARKLDNNFSLYTKIGYFNESIKYLGYDFKGWNCMLGIEIK